ncbi:hypothetical protein V8C37DRAFT_83116 [Trichoderma ceciliae]
MSSQTPAHDRPSLHKRMKRQFPQGQRLTSIGSIGLVTRQTQHTRFHTTSRSCARTVRRFLVRRCDKAQQPPPRLPLRFGWPWPTGSVFFFFFIFLSIFLSLFLCYQFPAAASIARPLASRLHSGAACRLDAASLPASDLRQQGTGCDYDTPSLRLTLPSAPCSTIEFCCPVSLRIPDDHAAQSTQVSSPRPQLPQQKLVLGRPSARAARLVSTTIHLVPGGVPSVPPPGVTSSPHVTWTNRCATTLKSSSLRIPTLPHLSLSLSPSLSLFLLPFGYLFPPLFLQRHIASPNAADEFGIELTFSSTGLSSTERQPPLLLPSYRIGPTACQALSKLCIRTSFAPLSINRERFVDELRRDIPSTIYRSHYTIHDDPRHCATSGDIDDNV